MTVTALRVFVFSILPLLAGSAHAALDKTVTSRERRLEVLLLYLFALGVAANGMSGAFGHLFLSDFVAESIGWPVGSPFQLEVGFANLTIGVLGIVAVGRRDGFREATVIAVAVFGVGATIVHVIDIVATGNLAPGNTIQNASNLIRPALLIGILSASRRAERRPDSEAGSRRFQEWRTTRIQAAWQIVMGVSAGFGVGFALEQTVIGATLGLVAGATRAVMSLRREKGPRTR
jgi:4-amino-4-deoxy-L-arabinose transferase-like glycosyltransferase